MLRAVGRQGVDFDFMAVFNHPCLNRLAVMDAQIVHDKNDLGFGVLISGVLDQLLHELDENRCVEALAIYHLAHFALIGDRGDPVDGKPLGTIANQRSFAHWA